MTQPETESIVNGSKLFGSFLFPQIHDNLDGWGPCEVPEQFRDTPYQPFSKDDRLGKVADWSGSMYTDRRSANKYGNVYGLGGQMYTYQHGEDESTFQLVDTAKLQRPLYQKGRPRFNQQKIRRDRERREERRMGGKQQMALRGQRDRERQRKRKKKWGNFNRYEKNQPSQRTRDPSVSVRSDWEVVHEIEFSQLSKLNFTPGTPEELCVCGSLGYYDVSKEKKITLKSPLPLQSCDRVFHTVTTTDDPVIRRLAKSPDCKVFATDTIIATLMTCARSNYSWDIVVQRIEDKLFFDKRDNSQFDLLTVSEKAKEPPHDDSGINAPTSLALEATYINHNFSQQMLMESQSMDFREPNPFASDEAGQVASVAYRYMKWYLKDGVGLVVRCEYDAVLPPPNKPTYISIKALNEWDSKLSGGMDWRKKLDPQRGAVLATELKNNSCKISKWAICSHLAGTSFIKCGYVSRKHPRDSTNHEILGVQQVKPAELAQMATLDISNSWGVLQAIVDVLRGFKQKEKTSKYLILKDPNKPVVRIYSVPQDAFESSDESDDSDSGDEGAS